MILFITIERCKTIVEKVMDAPTGRAFRVRRKSGRMRDSIKLRCCRRRDRRQADLHRTSAFNLFESLSECRKRPHPVGVVFFWQRMRDSNPRERSQSPVCYRYTNPLCNGLIISICRQMSSIDFPFSQKLFPGIASGESKSYLTGFQMVRVRSPTVSTPASREAVPKLWTSSYLPSTAKVLTSIPGFTASRYSPRL